MTRFQVRLLFYVERWVYFRGLGPTMVARFLHLTEGCLSDSLREKDQTHDSRRPPYGIQDQWGRVSNPAQAAEQLTQKGPRCRGILTSIGGAMSQCRHFNTLASVLFSLPLFTTLVTAQSAPPLGDTYSNSARPATNFGSQTTLLMQEGANIYIQFNLATLPSGASVSRATLRLFASGVTTSGSFDVYPVDSSWTESTLNYNNEPSLGASVTSPPIAVNTSSVNQFVLIDITSLVQGWVAGTVPNNGIALVLQGTTGSFSFDSKENKDTSHHPELEIAMTGPVGPQGPQGPTGLTGPAGPIGAPGATGAAGLNAYTTTASSFTQPASGSNTATIALGNSSWMSVGQVVFLTSGGYYSVASTPTGTSAVLTNLGYTGNASSGTTIATAQAVSPAGLIGATGGITGVAAGTDLTGGGTSGNVTVNLDTTKVPTLAASNTFSGANTFSSTITGSVTGSAANVTGTVAIANGGTGATTA
ncbi:MAG TPA: DNRLRE domain-containing protein, partial [Terracidiphilus sp.]|nr:DNRLRE domain-containing protein [Terracidiphilus sp.]